MMMTQERRILRGQVVLEEMVAFVGQAAKDPRPIDEVERGLWTLTLKLGHAMLEEYVDRVGPGDLGETLTYEGRVLRRLEARHDRRYVSVFGALTIPRHVYGTRETQKHEVIPTDAVLCLPDSDFSAVLQEWDLQRNRRFMRYDEYLAAGYPIGSGVVEGACRHLVKDRMEQTGMRWRIAGAQAVLSLRAIYLNDDWDTFHADRIQAEQRKLYPYKPRLPAILNCAT
jgi:hypothetical protein